MAKKKTPKPTVKAAHRRARKMIKSGAKVENPYALGMWQAKRAARKRKRSR